MLDVRASVVRPFRPALCPSVGPAPAGRPSVGLACVTLMLGVRTAVVRSLRPMRRSLSGSCAGCETLGGARMSVFGLGGAGRCCPVPWWGPRVV